MGKKELNENSFIFVEQIGQGTYGDVYLAKIKDTGESVALKKIKFHKESEGFPITTLREIKILLSTKHTNIIELKNVITKQNKGKTDLEDVFLVFEYCEADLVGIQSNIRDKNLFWLTQDQMCSYAYQILNGIKFLHENKIMHRDLKASNILVTKDNCVKIADFGLSIIKMPSREFTNKVITLWYRPPELLLGEVNYDYSIDIWSLGCILLEMFTGKSPFTARDEFKLLEEIFNAFGTPSKSDLEYLQTLPLFSKIKVEKSIHRRGYTYWTERATRYIGKGAQIPESAFDLMEKMLQYNPKKRISAEDALKHPYFNDVVDHTLIAELDCLAKGVHEFQCKGTKRKRESS